MIAKSSTKEVKKLSFSGLGVFVGFGIIFVLGGLATAASQSIRAVVWNLPGSADISIAGMYAAANGVVLLIVCWFLAKRNSGVKYH